MSKCHLQQPLVKGSRVYIPATVLEADPGEISHRATLRVQLDHPCDAGKTEIMVAPCQVESLGLPEQRLTIAELEKILESDEELEIVVLPNGEIRTAPSKQLDFVYQPLPLELERQLHDRMFGEFYDELDDLQDEASVLLCACEAIAEHQAGKCLTRLHEPPANALQLHQDRLEVAYEDFADLQQEAGDLINTASQPL